MLAPSYPCHPPTVFLGRAASSGLRQNLEWDDFKYLPCALPPLEEQNAIVRYLDDADQRIREYVSAKERLIALLEEERRATIHKAVTRGLDSNVKLRPSGVEWLGDVPEHWIIIPGKSAFSLKKTSNQGMKESVVLSLSYGKIRIRPDEELHGLVPESFETYQVIEPGDIICRPTDLQNDWNSLRFGISDHKGIITSAYFCLRTLSEVDRKFGHKLLHTYDLMKVFYGLGSGLRQNLGWEDFKYLPCILPPYEEQVAIATYLGKL